MKQQIVCLKEVELHFSYKFCVVFSFVSAVLVPNILFKQLINPKCYVFSAMPATVIPVICKR